MAKLGDAKFNKVLNSHGGFVIDHDHIKYIIAKEIPSSCSVVSPINQIAIRFGLENNKLVSRLGVLVYEPLIDKAFITNNIKFIGFNLKTYQIIDRKPIRRQAIGGQVFTVYQLVGVEVL